MVRHSAGSRKLSIEFALTGGACPDNGGHREDPWRGDVRLGEPPRERALEPHGFRGKVGRGRTPRFLRQPPIIREARPRANSTDRSKPAGSTEVPACRWLGSRLPPRLFLLISFLIARPRKPPPGADRPRGPRRGRPVAHRAPRAAQARRWAVHDGQRVN